MPYLHSQQLVGYIDGSTKAPSKTVTQGTGDEATTVANPAYLTWYQQDQAVQGALLSSMTEEALSHVMTCTTAAEVWKELESTFGCRSQAKIMQLRIQLTSLQKKGMSMDDYYQKVKKIADTMAMVGEPLKEQEIIAYLLTGLGSDYDSLVTSVTTRAEPMNLSELYSNMISYELRHEHNTAMQQININNNISNNFSTNQAGRGRGRTGGGLYRGQHFGGGRGRGQAQPQQGGGSSLQSLDQAQKQSTRRWLMLLLK